MMCLCKLKKIGSFPLIVLLSACGLTGRCSVPDPLEATALEALYAEPMPPPADAMRVYHLGHSLVGHDIPAMVQQLAGVGHVYESQLGWGTPLKAHWEPDEVINGFDNMNSHPRHRDARTAVASGDYDAVVLTEMVEIKSAVAYFDSWKYLRNWAASAWQARPETRVYLYETWHKITDPEGWLTRLDRDLGMYWETEILARALNNDDLALPVYVIPAGQVFAAFVRALEIRNGVDGVTGKEDLFGIREDGTQDPIHLNDIGAYLVALTHYAVLYHRDPTGLPHALLKANGSSAEAPGPEAARLMQEIVWDVVTSYPKTGVAPQGP